MDTRKALVRHSYVDYGGFYLQRRWMMERLFPYFSTKHRTWTIAYYLFREPSAHAADALRVIRDKMIGSENPCRMCDEFLETHAYAVGVGGHSCFQPCDDNGRWYTAARKALDGCKVDMTRIHIIQSGSIGTPSNQSNGRTYTHFGANFAADGSNPNETVPADVITLVHRGVHHWLPIFRRIFAELAAEKGVQESLTCCIKLLDDAAYGYRLKPCAEWIRTSLGAYKAARDDVSRMAVIIDAMVPNLVKGTDGVDCPHMTQFNSNLRSLMTHARDKDAFISMVRDRLDPTKYMISTGDVPVDKLLRVQKYLDSVGFTQTILTLDRLRTMIPRAMVPPEPSTSRSAPTTAADTMDKIIADMAARAPAPRRRRTVGGFARAVREEPGIPRTFVELCARVGSLPGLDVKITTGMIPIQTSHYPKTARAMFAPGSGADQGFLWTFLNGDKVTSAGCEYVAGLRPGWHRVTFVLRAGKHVLVGIRGARASHLPVMYHVYPEFLSTDLHALRDGFSLLNKSELPTATDAWRIPAPAFGIGTSKIKTDDTMCNSMTFRYKGKTFHLRRFGEK